MLSNWRIPGYVSTRIFNHVVIALLTGLTYLNIGNALVDAQYRIFIVFQVTVLPSLLLSQVEARYHVARSISEREKSSKMYSSLVFVLANIASELPLSLVCSVVVGDLHSQKVGPYL
jgi:ATP-binding cassette subfamily G (WHITE) protein 2 (SNQ2)